MSWLDQRRTWLAVDTETSGLSPWKERIRLVQFGDTETAWVMRTDRWLGVALEALNKTNDRIVFHNASFDIHFLERAFGELWGNKWSQTFDTSIMSPLLDPVRSRALKSLSGRYLTPQAKKAQRALDNAISEQKWGWGDIPLDFPLYLGYAGLDCILTARIAEDFWPRIDTECRAVYDLEMQVLRICHEMERRGVLVDVPYMQQMYDKITDYCSQVESYCLSEWGVRPSENEKVAEVLLAQGCPLTALTPTGETAMGADILSPYVAEFPLAGLVIQHRKKQKVGNTYFKNFLESHEMGVLHPSINTLGAKTGRMSISSPALQTLPRGPVVRDAFIANSCESIYSIDYAGIEARLFAHFAGEEELIKVFKAGFDPHAYTAQQVFNVEIPTKEQRQIAKNCTFALLYGAGPEKVGWTAGITTEEADRFLTTYKARFPGVAKFMKSVEAVAKRRLSEEGRGYVKTPLGRLEVGAKTKLYALVNALVQGTAADVFKRALVDLDNVGLGPYLLLPVHDEVLFSLPEGLPVQDISAIMGDSTSFRVPLICESSGPFERWGDKWR